MYTSINLATWWSSSVRLRFFGSLHLQHKARVSFVTGSWKVWIPPVTRTRWFGRVLVFWAASVAELPLQPHIMQFQRESFCRYMLSRHIVNRSVSSRRRIRSSVIVRCCMFVFLWKCEPRKQISFWVKKEVARDYLRESRSLLLSWNSEVWMPCVQLRLCWERWCRVPVGTGLLAVFVVVDWAAPYGLGNRETSACCVSSFLLTLSFLSDLTNY